MAASNFTLPVCAWCGSDKGHPWYLARLFPLRQRVLYLLCSAQCREKLSATWPNYGTAIPQVSQGRPMENQGRRDASA